MFHASFLLEVEVLTGFSDKSRLFESLEGRKPSDPPHSCTVSKTAWQSLQQGMIDITFYRLYTFAVRHRSIAKTRFTERLLRR